MSVEKTIIFRSGLILLLLLGATPLFYAQQAKHVQAIARPGDGILSLLRLYNLESESCNLQYFYEVNKLDSEDHLDANNSYTLPLYYFEYNGKSIRTTIGNDNFENAKKIQEYNRKMVANKLQASQYEESKVLWVPHHLLSCKSPELEDAVTEIEGETPEPVLVETNENSIFGIEYATIPELSNKLKGKVYYIVSGHGGPDPGAIGKKDGKSLCEDEYAYDVALRLARNLMGHGAKAYMIIRDWNDGIRTEQYLPCDRDEECWGGKTIPLDAKEKLTQRSNAINSLYQKNRKAGIPYADQLTIVIHVDSRNKSEKIDLFFYHFPGSKNSKSIAETLQQTIKEKYDHYQPGRGYSGVVTGRDLFMLRETKTNAVYIELANIRNKYDLRRIIIDGNRQALAEWFTDGLLKTAEK